MGGKKRHLLGRRDMEHMHAPARRCRELEQPLRRATCRFRIAPKRMRRGQAARRKRPPLDKPRLVLGMHGHAPPAVRERARDVRVLGEEKRAGGRAHEELDAAHAGEPFEAFERVDIVGRRADIESVVAMHAPLRALQLVGKRLRARGRRFRVRHFEDGGDAAENGRARARLEIFLVLQSRLAEMHLRVDHPGQHMKPAHIEHASPRLRSKDRRWRRCGRHARRHRPRPRRCG